jgi:hypothetical protein
MNFRVDCWNNNFDDIICAQSFIFNNINDAQECRDIEERCGTWDSVTIEEIAE